MAKFTDKQRRFVQEYLKDLNATQAAKRAGYSGKTAYSIGQRLLKNVEIKQAIEKGLDRQQRQAEITQDRVLQELAAIAFASGADYASIISGVVMMNDTEELTEEQKAAIVSIKQTKEGVEVKLADKMRALELLAKHLGLLQAQEKQEDGMLLELIKGLQE